MASPAYIKDNSGNWQEIATATTDLSNYANLTNTPVSGFRNVIINGDFKIWQRGTSFTSGSGTYTADRWLYSFDGSGATRTISQQMFTPGNPILGYEPQYFLRYAQSVAGSAGTYNIIGQKIEDARTFAGQTVTISFWAKAASNTTITTGFDRNYGTGGSSSDNNTNIVSHSLTTSWQRFTTTVTVASVSGKTIGANSFLWFWFGLPLNSTFTVDIWGVQVERGTIATPFEQRPIGVELDLCYRYFERYTQDNAQYLPQSPCNVDVANRAEIVLNYYPKRTSPVITSSGQINVESLTSATATNTSNTVQTLVGTKLSTANLFLTVTWAQYLPCIWILGSSTSYIDISAEL